MTDWRNLQSVGITAPPHARLVFRRLQEVKVGARVLLKVKAEQLKASLFRTEEVMRLGDDNAVVVDFTDGLIARDIVSVHKIESDRLPGG